MLLQPFPYQGSKRKLTPRILPYLARARPRVLFEPFAGSAAVTIAAAEKNLAEKFVLGDSFLPLARLWQEILDCPTGLSETYKSRWETGDYETVREDFNRAWLPEDLLYLLCRCVKGAVRFNRQGQFNQSADRRRKGMRPDRLAKVIDRVSCLLRGRTRVEGGDYEWVLHQATPHDVIYFDPPYVGTSGVRDTRYAKGLNQKRFVACLSRLRSRGVPFVVSLDGRCGEKTYGPGLPAELGLIRFELDAGRSTQATLLGRNERTIESLYVVPDLKG